MSSIVVIKIFPLSFLRRDRIDPTAKMSFNLFPKILSWLVPFCSHLRVSPTRKSRQLHPKNRSDDFLIRSHARQMLYRFLCLKVRAARSCHPSLFCTYTGMVLSFLARGNSCISASHTNGSHV